MYTCTTVSRHSRQCRATTGRSRAFFGHEIVRQNKIFREAGVRGMTYEPSYLAHHATWIGRQSALLDQVEFYITWRLADNPELDGNKLIDEFFVRYYGAAAKPMRRFYEEVERIFWDKETTHQVSKGRSFTGNIWAPRNGWLSWAST